jgi:hypothetical protein
MLKAASGQQRLKKGPDTFKNLVTAFGRKPTFVTIKMMLSERLLCAEQRTVNECERLGQLSARRRHSGAVRRKPAPFVIK